MDKKYVYEFNEGDETMRELLGGKGANLAGMSKLRYACALWIHNHYRSL